MQQPSAAIQPRPAFICLTPVWLQMWPAWCCIASAVLPLHQAAFEQGLAAGRQEQWNAAMDPKMN